MPSPTKASAHDMEAVLAKRHHNGGDHWATPDGRIYVGSPFSTLSSLLMLHEFGVDRDHEAVRGGLDLILNASRNDGRIRLAPKAPLYPCYTAEAARVLCRFGLLDHESLLRTVSYLKEDVHGSGGWRCNFKRFGSGPETECANPGATLFALDVFRFFERYHAGDAVIDHAVESLLRHWQIRKPIGPCHYGIGSLFMQVEFPFLRYNLFFYVYVLSFYEYARKDSRFAAARSALEEKLDGDGKLVIGRPHRGLKGLEFCTRGQPSELATARYREIRENLDLT